MNENEKIVLLIDFNNLVFCSHYTSPQLNKFGEQVNTIKNFFYKLRGFKETFNPDYIIFASDLSRTKTFRRKLYPEYKAQRKPIDETISKQMTIIENLLSLSGFPIYNDLEYEADDIIGMISKYCEENNYKVIIISSDRDLYQLLSDKVFIMSPKNNILIDKNWLYDNYRLTPDQWIDLKILQGDKSDNIPGVYGIGEVTALHLLKAFNNIDNIYKNLNKIVDKVRNLLVDGKENIELTRKLVTILRDYNIIKFDENKLTKLEIFKENIYQVLMEHDITSLSNIFDYCLLN